MNSASNDAHIGGIYEKKLFSSYFPKSDGRWFLDASSHLYKRVCPSVSLSLSVGRSVGPSVRPSVRRSVRDAFVKIAENGLMQDEDASYVVYTALFLPTAASNSRFTMSGSGSGYINGCFHSCFHLTPGWAINRLSCRFHNV